MLMILQSALKPKKLLPRDQQRWEWKRIETSCFITGKQTGNRAIRN
jgi:hypothetical protein